MTNMPRKLVVAVSGGVDSVVLLHQLSSTDYECIVAHVDHGIRDDSNEDEALVRKLASDCGLLFVSTKLSLGRNASEEQARKARYEWLEQVREEHGADAIATAHHQDDVLETIIINILRGTGWRGLCSLRSTAVRYRPLLQTSKAEIVAYALEKNLEWREDSTNETFKYLRNRVRNLIVPHLSGEERTDLLKLYEAQVAVRANVNDEVSLLHESFVRSGNIDRHVLIMSNESVAFELLRAWLGESLESLRFHSLLRFAKVARAGDKWSLNGTRFVRASQRDLIVSSPQD